jgi:N-acetylmuramoyl-L-alanine amidase
MKICIDPGHGGSDSGGKTDNPFFYLEKEFNLTFSLLLEKKLKELGHSVVMVRRSDHSVSLEARASFANRLKAGLFVSIHANAASNPRIEGMEVFHFPGSKNGHLAAEHVLNSMIAAFPNHRNRGVKEANLVVLRLTLMPAILIECEFLTNPTQLLFLTNPENQKKLATAIANGLNKYISI